MHACPTSVRRVTKQCRRHPLVAVAVLGLVAYLMIFISGVHDLHKQKVEVLTFPVADLEEKFESMRNISQANEAVEPDDISGSFSQDQQKRLDRIQEVCSESARPLGFLNSLISTRNLTYCVIPKSANTFWLQAFRFHNFDYLGDKPASPFDMNVKEVHNRPFSRTRLYKWRRLTVEERTVMLATKSFLSVQDPYQRLWTTYVNSLLLPDMWFSVGAKIESKRKKDFAEIMRSKTGPKQGCGSNVTFAEFVDYAMTSYENDFESYYRQCDPCQLKPSYIIKSETSARDNQEVLKHLDLAWTLDQPNVEEEMAIRYIRNTVKDTFTQMKNPRTPKCTTYADLTRRLWRVFIVFGYIAEEISLPPINEDVHEENLIKTFTDLYKKAKETGLDAAVQKKKYMIGAFRHLKPAMLEKIREKYRMDFRLFGYDDMPSDIYSTDNLD